MTSVMYWNSLLAFSVSRQVQKTMFYKMVWRLFSIQLWMMSQVPGWPIPIGRCLWVW